MALIRSFTTLILLVASSSSFAAPELRLEAGYTQFELQRQFDEPLFYAPYLFHDHDTYDSNDAVHAAVELAWSAGEHLEWITAISAAYSSQMEKRSDIRSTTSFLTLGPLKPVSGDFYTVGLRGGLRWQQPLTTKLKLHADAALSLNQWRYHYHYSYLDMVNTGPGMQFVTREVDWKDDDRYVALDGTVGLYYAVTPALDAVLDASGQLGQDYRNTQFNAGLRYRFR